MAYLIIGGDKKNKNKKIRQICNKNKLTLENNPDKQIILPNDKGNIGIKEITKIKKFLAHKNWQGKKKKLIIVDQAEAMTREAQNAFLKTLEETSSRAVIILLANSKNALLTTIISRCQINQLKSTENFDPEKTDEIWTRWQKISNSDPGEKISLLKNTNPEDLKNFIIVLQSNLSEEGVDKYQLRNQLENLITAREMADSYVKFSRVVDWLALKL